MTPSVDGIGALGGAGGDGPRRDAGEHAHLGEPSGPLDRLPRAARSLAVEQVVAVPVLNTGGTNPSSMFLSPSTISPSGRFDGPDLDVGVLLLEVRADAHERARGAEPGDEVGDVGDVGQISGPVPS
jgi:hypothetical protein